MALLEGSLRITESVEAAEYRGLRDEAVIVGDGRRRDFLIPHTLGTRHVLPQLYDNSGRPVFAQTRPVSASEILVSFFAPPAAGESFTVVVRR